MLEDMDNLEVAVALFYQGRKIMHHSFNTS
jgi:hypothetical protein